MKKPKKTKNSAAPAPVSAPAASGFKSFYSSVWLFPAVLTVLLFALTLFKISGTSVGVYHNIFYNGTKADADKVFGKPREVRSDEWVVNTQMTLAQEEANYPHINKNIGNGQDMSVVIDVPYKDWSQLFRPHNWSFFVMPFDNAFAFKWWSLAYLLAISCYFFVLALLPGRRLLAAALAVGLVFGGMIQWWYQFITLAPVYYALFLATTAIYVLRAKRRAHRLWLGALFAYLVASFALVLYPPFQIACALGLGAFLIGYLLQALRETPRREVIEKLGVLSAAVLVGGLVVLLFVHTRSGVIDAITNTAYPGQRVIQSGGFDLVHIFAGHTQFLLQSTSRSQHYFIDFPAAGGLVPLNQSEASNFILLLPFLFLPSLYIILQDIRRKRAMDWPLITVNLAFLFLVTWMLVPHIPLFGKLFALEKAQLIRLLLGFGLLNLFQSVLVARRLKDFTGRFLSRWHILAYAVVVLGIEIWLGLITMQRSPGFITFWQVLALSLPIPIIVYLLLRKRIILAAIGLAVFSMLTTGLVNPLYRGTETISQTPLSQTIRQINQQEPGIWVTEVIYLGNVAAANGAHSLTGVYTYPQLQLWKPISNTKDDYNRYAHTTFEFDRDPATQAATKLTLVRPDYFNVTTEPCGSFVHQEHIRYVLAVNELSDPCAKLIQTVKYPSGNKYLIYKID
jgi:hypothetical protein